VRASQSGDWRLGIEAVASYFEEMATTATGHVMTDTLDIWLVTWTTTSNS
jgi:hypothetical protein